MKTKEEIFKLIMSEPDESALIVELSEQIDQQFKRIEELEAALRSALPYVEGAYECAFPDEQENEYVREKIESLLQ